MASLEYVKAGWLRSRRLTVALVGASRRCGSLRPRPLPRQGGGLGPRNFLPGGGRLGRRGGGRPWLDSGGRSPVYLVPLWALFSSVRSLMGWALLSSKVWPSGLSGALLPWSGSFWRCKITLICTPLFGPRSRRRYWIVPSHQIQSPVWSSRKGCWTFAPFLNSGYAVLVLLAGGWMMRMLGPGGVVVMVGGRMTRMRGPGWGGGSVGVRGVGRLLPCRLIWPGWDRVRPFSVSLAWVGLEVVELGGRGVGRRGA